MEEEAIRLRGNVQSLLVPLQLNMEEEAIRLGGNVQSSWFLGSEIWKRRQ